MSSKEFYRIKLNCLRRPSKLMDITVRKKVSPSNKVKDSLQEINELSAGSDETTGQENGQQTGNIL